MFISICVFLIFPHHPFPDVHKDKTKSPNKNKMTTDKDRSSALGSIEVQVIVPPRYGSPDSLLEK
jgi:hypothetical protein